MLLMVEAEMTRDGAYCHDIVVVEIEALKNTALKKATRAASNLSAATRNRKVTPTTPLLYPPHTRKISIFRLFSRVILSCRCCFGYAYQCLLENVLTLEIRNNTRSRKKPHAYDVATSFTATRLSHRYVALTS